LTSAPHDRVLAAARRMNKEYRSTMMNPNQPTSTAIHEAAIRIARQCRRIVQGCLREEEWQVADLEFYRVAREELEAFQLKKDAHPEGPAPD
jgi:hypothetical protein